MPNVQSVSKEEKKLLMNFFKIDQMDIVAFSRFVVGVAVRSLQEQHLASANTAHIRHEIDRLEFPEWPCFKDLRIQNRNISHFGVPRTRPSSVIDALGMYSDRIARHLTHYGCQPKNEKDTRNNMCIWKLKEPVTEEKILNVKVR